MEIDHIFICTERNAAVGNLLLDFGLVEGTSNNHPGQGTASRRFYFHNCMLELLWAEDLEELNSERTKPLRFYERCVERADTTSPIGLIFRPEPNKKETASFSTWDYHPVYLPDFLKMQVADNTPLSEPMYFYFSFARRQDMVSVEKRQAMEHKVLLNEVTNVTVVVKQDVALSHAAQIINELQGIKIVNGNQHRIEMEFDEGKHNQSKDFRPNLPLIIRW